MRIWLRDEGRCQGPYCTDAPPWSVPLAQAHIDHIISGKLGSNADSNLRVLCRRCHVLRANKRHRGMIAAALRDGIIPPDWRTLVWDGCGTHLTHPPSCAYAPPMATSSPTSAKPPTSTSGRHPPPPCSTGSVCT
ncbi:MAG: HNH endonuclease [Chloroflexaceae bacterium]|nr:HNH endonuclease [Chloroflexaceae bacterium]